MFPQSRVLKDVSERPRSFWFGKTTTTADETGGSNSVTDNTVATGWLGQGCGAHVVRELCLLHRTTQDGKQGHAWESQPVSVVMRLTRNVSSMCVGAEPSVCACGHAETTDVA